MRYFVTGATGFFGTGVVERLTADGHEVVALTRAAERASHLPASVSVVEGDIAEAESMREAMDGADGVFHLAGWYHIGPGQRGREQAQRINVEGTRTVLSLVDELDIPKCVYTSTCGVFDSTGDDTFDETHRPQKPELSVYNQSKWQAHFEVAEPMIDGGTPVCILMPGVVFGPGDRPSSPTRRAINRWLNGDLPVVPREFVVPYVYIDDVVDAIIKTMDRGDIGESYIIAEESRPVTQFFEVAEQIAGRSPPRQIHQRWFRLLAKVLSPIHRVWTVPEGFEPEYLRSLGGTQLRVDNRKGLKALELSYTPFEDAVQQYLEWELEVRN